MSARAVCGCGWTGTYRTRAKAEEMAARHVCPGFEIFERPRPRVRRATRRYRCKRCGLEATYENAGATEARYWFSKHSCRKHEQAMLRHAMAEARDALIDRTPKPCLHKQANHQHGTRACYVLDRCRCTPCSKANSEAENWRERQKAYGRYHKYVNAEHVRAHLAELKAYGIGLKQVTCLSGVSNGSLTKIWYGLYATTGTGTSGGRNGNGKLLRGPTRRVLRSTAEKIYAVEPIPANLGPRRPDYERTPLARTHLRALVALGWSMQELGRRLGMNHPRNAIPMIVGDQPIRRVTVDKIEALFDQLCMTPPPENTKAQKGTATRARRYAKAHGWRPPLALDDLDTGEAS